MTRWTDRELARKLTQPERPEPPEGLLERLKAEIPENFEGLDPVEHDRTRRSGVRRRILLLAASVVMVAGGGMLAYRLALEAPPVGDRRTLSAELVDRVGPETEAKGDGEATSHQSSGELSDVSGLGDQRFARSSSVGEVAGERAEVQHPPAEGRAWTPQGLERRRPEPHGDERDLADRASGGGPEREAKEEPRADDRRAGGPAAGARPDFDAQSEKLAHPSPEKERGLLAAGAPPAGPQARGERSKKAPSGTQEPKAVAPSWVATATAAPDAAGVEGEGSVGTGARGRAAPRDMPGEGERDRRPAERQMPPSTGGTAEPNDQPYGDAFFEHYGVSPFIDTEDDPLSTFGLEVDTGSYTVVRGYLREGHLPPPAAVRVEEMVNFFDYRDAPPREGDFALYAEGAPSLWAPGPRYQLLRFAIRGREMRRGERRPAVLTFVVDTSGSMGYDDRLDLVKEALELLLDHLRPEDRVALVTYGDRARVIVPHTGDREAVLRALSRLVPEGSTNAEEGLVLGYELAGEAFEPGAVNRVVLCSDGVANVGRTGADSIYARLRREAQRGIELTAVGVGLGNYNDVLLERLADQADGRYAYVDTLEEARRLFVEDLTGTLQTLAHEARAQVELNPAVVARYRLLGYENREIADDRFRDDSVDAGEIGLGHAVTALYEVKLHSEPDPSQPLATLRLRYRPAGRQRFVEIAETLRLADLEPSWEQASPAYRLATLVASFAEVLRGSYWAREVELEELFRRAQRLQARFEGDAEVAELVSLVGRAGSWAERDD